MKIAVFNAKPYDRQFLSAANEEAGHEIVFLEPRLSTGTTALAGGYEAVCIFVNDRADAPVLEELARGGTRLLALRCAGFNNVDLEAARRLGMTVVRVPAYSPHAVAEHAVGLILSLNRNIHRAYTRVREGNFALQGLLGFDLFGKTVGVVGTGQIGANFAAIMRGFGCRVLCYDLYRNPRCEAMGAEYVEMNELLAQADIVSLHCPLTPETKHLINAETLALAKPGFMLINTGRGALLDTAAVIEALKSKRISHLGLDVYEEEAALFFEDRSDSVIQDDLFARLQTFPNVLITGHQAFFTAEALTAIAETTLGNVTAYESGQGELHEVKA